MKWIDRCKVCVVSCMIMLILCMHGGCALLQPNFTRNPQRDFALVEDKPDFHSTWPLLGKATDLGHEIGRVTLLTTAVAGWLYLKIFDPLETDDEDI